MGLLTTKLTNQPDSAYQGKGKVLN